MNANEFANELEKAPTLWFKDDIAGKWIIEKLRQQQAEIEALKQIIDANNLSQNIGQFAKPAKTLTDAEIRTIQDMCHLKNVGYNTFIMRFARAILRKAQEK
jgi:hypothetical protein